MAKAKQVKAKIKSWSDFKYLTKSKKIEKSEKIEFVENKFDKDDWTW
jgi:hypothetical protein